MSQIDLDDLPPKIAKLLASVQPGDEVALVRGGLLVARLTVAEQSAPASDEDPDAAPTEEQVSEVMSQFNAMIHDEF